FAGRARRCLKSNAFQRKRISSVETERRKDSREALDFLHDGICSADLHGDLCWIAAKTVAVDLYRVAAGIRTGVWENSQDLRTVAEGVRGDGEPAVLKIGSEVDGAVREAWRRSRLDLSGTGNRDARS